MSAGFDAMAVAVDWLDAYRAARLDTILDLYADGATLECGCGGQKILIGKTALREYWIRRFAEKAPLELDDLQPEGEDVELAYQTKEGLVRVVFSFNVAGKIAHTRCGPPAPITPLRPASS
jgi:ketosteroid isomerase-like protein